MGNYKQGTYKVKNKDKYKGDPNKIRYMSSWEEELCKYFDKTPSIIAWNSEEVIIKYYSHMDQRVRRYIIDFWVKYIDNNGKTHIELIECKPYSQTQKPTKRGRKKESTYIKEVYTYNVNIDKWTAASKYAKQMGWEFRILTEKDIFF